MKNWREIVRGQMDQLGVTQEHLAEGLGMTQGGLGHWLNGKRQPPFEKVAEIADFLGIDRAVLGAALLDADAPRRKAPEPEHRQINSLEIRQITAALIQAYDAGKLSKDLTSTILKMIEIAAPKTVQESVPIDSEPPATRDSIYRKQAVIDNRENLMHHKDEFLQERRSSKKKGASEDKSAKSK